METLSLVYLKILEISSHFWIKTILTGLWVYFVWFFNLQYEGHTAIVLLFILDGIIGGSHAKARGDFDRNIFLNKFKVKLFAYATVILTGFSIDLAVIRGHADFGFHYAALVYLTLTEASSISGHLEAFNIRVPFRGKIDKMLAKLYTK